MIITDGVHLLVSRKEGETCGISFPAISLEGDPILAMAVGADSFALGESFTSDNALDEDVDLTPSEFAKEAKALAIDKPLLVALIPGGKSVTFSIPEGKEWEQITADITKLVVVFDDGVVSVADNLHPAVEPTAIGVITQYSMYAHQNQQLPKTYDLFFAQTGELIENATL